MKILKKWGCLMAGHAWRNNPTHRTCLDCEKLEEFPAIPKVTYLPPALLSDGRTYLYHRHNIEAACGACEIENLRRRLDHASRAIEALTNKNRTEDIKVENVNVIWPPPTKKKTRKKKRKLK